MKYVLVTVAILGILACNVIVIVGKILETDKKNSEFYFEGNKEVTRIYYEGYITVKSSDGTFEIILEDYDKEDYEELR